MKKYIFIIVCIALVVIGLFTVRFGSAEDSWICVDGQWAMHGKPNTAKPAFPCPVVAKKEVSSMKLYSAAFGENEFIPKIYSCDGAKRSPPLSISEVPPDTKTLALIMEDPDAPDNTFIHWTMWNIPPDSKELEEGVVPDGIMEGANSGGSTGYYPPCPPVSTHRYIFTLYALDSRIDLPASGSVSQLRTAMERHILAQTQLTGLYKR